MKNLLLSTALLVVACFAFTACSEDDTVIDFNQDIDVTIQGIVYDNNGNEPLSGVTTFLVGKDSVSTDDDGSYQYTGNETGSHLMKFEKSGYATMVQTIIVSGNEFTAEELTNSSAIFMFEANQSLSTTLKISNGVETISAADADVTITLPEQEGVFFESNIISATTDSDGVLSLDGLPDVFLEINVELEVGTDLYWTTIFTTPGSESSSYQLNKTSLLGDLELVESNIVNDDGSDNDNFTASDNITFTFNENIESADVDLDRGDNVAFDLSISGSTVTIDPIGNALEESTGYSVSLDVIATNGLTYSEFFTFTVDGPEVVLDQVSGLDLSENQLEVTEFTTGILISFDAVEGANDFTGYQVFARYSEGNDEFVQLTANWNSAPDDDELEYFVSLTSGDGIVQPADGFFEDGDFEIIVRAVSGDVYGEFSSTLDVSEGDEG